MPAGQRGPLSTRGTSEAGGGVLPRSAASGAAMSKPSGGIRSLHSLSAWGLPTPVVALACIGNVDIQAFFLCKRSTLFCTAFASLCIKPPLKGEGNQRSWWRGSPATAASRFHKELRFFFSLLKRKKEAKKEKSSHSTCTVRFQYHPKITQEILTNKTPPEGHTGGCCRRNITLFTLEIGA